MYAIYICYIYICYIYIYVLVEGINFLDKNPSYFNFLDFPFLV